ncbi:thioredoxin family protein [uncultured Draconibacterium sp.]|uniref:thioredoxin family protein n=1 Tax=uncultured Draconibacterium sp. TaxID=1573823 RepID=UPI0029C6554F|nr:thioredoxin family protein [uncultured Draconibacterium sp.]
MKRFFLLLVLTALISNTFAQGINFEDLTVEQAVEQAKVEDKYVFIDVYTAWCSPCKMMDAQVFPTKEAGDYFNPRFVSLKLNAEAGTEGPKFANKYNVKVYPTYVVLDGNGDLVHMFSGGILDVPAFNDKVEEAFDENKAYGSLKKRYEAGDRESKLVASYLHASMNMRSDVTDLIDEFYKVSSDEDKITEECLFIFDKYAPIGSDREIFFRNNVAKFRKAVGDEKVEEIVKRKYEDYFGLIVKRISATATVEEIEKTANDLAEYGLSDLGKIPVFKDAAIYKLKQENKEAFLQKLKSDLSNMTEADKDLSLYIVIPGLKDLLTEMEKDDLLALVKSDKVKGYVIRAAYR